MVVNKMKETWNHLKRVYSFGRDYKKNMIVFTLASLLFIVINVIYPIFTAKQITYLTSGLLDQLMWATLVVFLFDILGAIRMVVIRKNTQIFFRGSFQKLQMKVSREILKITVSDIDKHSSGVFIERLNHDCSELSHIFSVGVGQLTGILTNIGVLVAVFIINPIIFLYYLLSSLFSHTECFKHFINRCLCRVFTGQIAQRLQGVRQADGGGVQPKAVLPCADGFRQRVPCPGRG